MVVSVSDFNMFVKKILSDELLSIKEIIFPAKSFYNGSRNLYFKKLSVNINPDPGEYRTVDPVKFLFYLSRTTVLPANYKGKRRLLVGAKACDLNALSILDQALLDSGFIDPSYKYLRENTIIISSDCTSFLPNCFCTMLNYQPYPIKMFDLNLSRSGGDYLITCGSPRGEEIIFEMKKHIPSREDTPDITYAVHLHRTELTERLNQKIQTTIDENSSASSDWRKISESCVGCGACTNVCPTCYCLILNDESVPDSFTKVRSYDSCQLNGYARVAGGGTPRPRVDQRFRNRIMCKFSYMKSNFSQPGCTGCGRCLDTCKAGLNIMLFGDRVAEIELSDSQSVKNKTGV